MPRPVAAAAAFALLALSVASADELKGTVKAVNAARNTITVTADGKDTTLPVSKDASFVSVKAVPGKKGKTTEEVEVIAAGLGGVRPGAAATLLTELVGDTDTVTSVKVSGATPAAAAKKKKKDKAK